MKKFIWLLLFISHLGFGTTDEEDPFPYYNPSKLSYEPSAAKGGYVPLLYKGNIPTKLALKSDLSGQFDRTRTKLIAKHLWINIPDTETRIDAWEEYLNPRKELSTQFARAHPDEQGTICCDCISVITNCLGINYMMFIPSHTFPHPFTVHISNGSEDEDTRKEATRLIVQARDENVFILFNVKEVGKIQSSPYISSVDQLKRLMVFTPDADPLP